MRPSQDSWFSVVESGVVSGYAVCKWLTTMLQWWPSTSQVWYGPRHGLVGMSALINKVYQVIDEVWSWQHRCLEHVTVSGILHAHMYYYTYPHTTPESSTLNWAFRLAHISPNSYLRWFMTSGNSSSHPDYVLVNLVCLDSLLCFRIGCSQINSDKSR